ncbi:MAG: phasin family protein [Actinobacteria bacterium]|jgi:polyhydroxyalkanoate synthesis regulator phasin|nr:phasin family protein [Actinomycetota bacterium]
MTSKFKEGYLASLGIAALTYEKATEVARNLIKKGELAKEKQQKFITDLMEEARKNTSEVTKMLNEKIDYLAKKGEPLKDKQDKVLKDIAARAKETGTITEIKLKDMFKEVKEKSASLKDKITGSDEDRIKQALLDLNIPSRQDLEEIRDKLDILIEESDSKKSKKE